MWSLTAAKLRGHYDDYGYMPPETTKLKNLGWSPYAK
jgi:hypothetical protein